MKRIATILILLLPLIFSSAETYTIVLKDSGTGSDKTSELTSSSTEDYIAQGEDLVTGVSSTKCYLAKSGYGLKFGTTSVAGSLTLTLKDTYRPTLITITAAAYNAKQDTANGKSFKLADTTQPFSSGTKLTQYEFVFDGNTDVSTINIAANQSSYNRFYVTQIQIEAPDPAPNRGEIYCPKSVDLGFEHLSAGNVETMTELDITAKNLASNIDIEITSNGNTFTADTQTLPKEGGSTKISFRSQEKAKHSAVLTLSSTGLDQMPVVKQVPIYLTVCSEILHSGEIDDPYTVSDALAQAEELTGNNETSSRSWYVKGVVRSNEITTSSTTGGLSFYLEDENDSIYVYSLTSEGGNLLNIADIHKGDTLLIRSRMQNYVVTWPTRESKKELYMGELVNSDIPSIDWRQLQPGYYDSIQGTSDTALMHILGSIISGGIRYTYGSGTHHTWDAFYYTDRETDGTRVLDMYSDSTRYFDPQNPTASVAGLDIEHMFPKSWWGGTVNNAYKDLYHLVPADYSANRSKGNDAPGEVVSARFDNGSFKIGEPADDCPANRVFEPADEYKGDFARAYFYILTAYHDFEWDLSTPAQYALDTESALLLQPWLQQLLLAWHRADPVSEKELNRIEQVSRIQHNRNPFIDYPCLAEYIWGNKQGEQVNLGSLLLTSTDEYHTTNDKSGCTCECTQTGVEEVENDYQGNDGITNKTRRAAQLSMRNGTIVIILPEGQFSITGQKIR